VVFDLVKKAGLCNQSLDEKQQDLNRVVGCFQTVIAEGIQQGLFRPMPIPATAKLLFLTLIGILEAMDYFKETDTAVYRQEMIDFLELLSASPRT